MLCQTTTYCDHADLWYKEEALDFPSMNIPDPRERQRFGKNFDVVMVWAVDRLGRSLTHLVSFLSEIHAKKVDLFIHQQGIDTTTPAGKALFGMMGVFAEFERSMIQERVKAGIKRVRAKGQRWGRRMIEETNPAVCARMLELRREGLGMGAIGKAVGLSSRTVWRFLRTAKTINLS